MLSSFVSVLNGHCGLILMIELYYCWMIYTFHLLSIFYNCIVPMGFLPWESRVAFPRKSDLQQSHVIQPTVHAGCFYNLLNSDMDYGIFNVCSAREVDWKNNPLPLRGTEPALAVCWPDAVPTELHLHHLVSNIEFCCTAPTIIKLLL